MSNYSSLKATINANIKQNGNEEITGPILNSVLNAMVDSLAGYLYSGIATPATNPGTPDSNVFYIASDAGTYTNFGGLIVAEGEVAILKYNGTWTKEVTGAATASEVSQLAQEVNGFTSKNYTEGYKVLQSGALEEDATSVVCDKVPVSFGDVLSFNNAYSFICAYDANDTKLDHWSARASVPLTSSLVQNVAYILCSFLKTNLATAYIKKGSTTLWKAEETVIPGLIDKVDTLEETVSEHGTSIEQVQEQINGTESRNYTDGYKVLSTGALEADETSVVCDKVPVSFGDVLSFNKAYSYICAYDENDVKLDQWSARASVPLTSSLVQNVAYILCSFLKSNLSTAYIRKGTTTLWQAESTGTQGILDRVGNLEVTMAKIENNIFDYNAVGANNGIKGIPLDIVQGHSYRLVPITRIWDVSGVSDGNAVFWLTVGVTEKFTVRKQNFVEQGLEPYYDFDITTETSAKVSFRASTGVNVSFRLLDKSETLPEGNYNRILQDEGRIEALETMGDILRLHPYALTAPRLANLNEIKSVDRNNPGGTIKNFVALFFSDLHSTKSALARMMEFYRAYSDYITQVVQGGDLIHTFDDTTEFSSVIEECGAEANIGVIGNHEKLSSQTMYVNGIEVASPFKVSPKILYETFYQPYLSETGIQIEQNQTYWYKDFAENQIRLIGIDWYHWNEQIKLVDNTYVRVYPDGTPCDTGQQATWLTDTLAGAKTLGYSVVAIIHNPAFYGNGAIQSPFTCLDYVGDNIVGQNANAAMTSIVQDFIDNGGKFVCWLTGHIHQDAIGTLQNYPQQFQINIDTCRYGARFGTLVAWGENKKILDTMSEDCFEVISVDSNRQYLSVMRFGCDSDRWGRHIGTFVYDYGNHRVVYNPNN